MKKQVISLILAFMMLFTMIPATVFATMVTIEEIDAAIVLNGYTDAQIKAMPLQDVLNLLQDTEGNPIEIAEDAKVVWAHFKDNEGNVIRDEYHVIERNESVDLSEFSYTMGYTMELIIGSGKQLDSSNVRYIVKVYMPNKYDEKIDFEFYNQQDDMVYTKLEPLAKEFAITDSPIIGGNGSPIPCWGYFYVFPEGNYQNVRMNMFSQLSEHPEVDVKIYEVSEYLANEEAGMEIYPPINEEILKQDMNSENSGYLMQENETGFFVEYDINGNKDIIMVATFFSGGFFNIDGEIFTFNDGEKEEIVYDEKMSVVLNETDEINILEYTLHQGYEADEEYYCNLSAYNHGSGVLNEQILKAVVGHYASMEDAADEADIKEQLFSSDGYLANYGNDGVDFTVFFTEGTIAGTNSYKLTVKTLDYPNPMPNFDAAPIVGARDPYFRVDGVKYDDEFLDTYVVENGKAINMDTLYGYGYQTLFINDTDVDLTQLKPTFWFGNEDRVHTTYVGTKQESGVSIQDFSNGAVQYGTIIDDNEKNYNVTFVKKEAGAKLFVNGPAQREILLDEYFEHKHDILIANIGTEELKEITVTLDATNVKLDDYWTVGGEKNNSLAAFTSTTSDSDYGELDNIGKIRLLPDGEGEIEGTLTISADGQEDVIINLTGRASNPTIVTETLENNHAVKYVPYAYLISTNNMNDWNEVDFQLVSGELPDGVTLNERTGEIYGVPTETGEFTFTVQADYSYEGFESSQKEFTLTVDDNTDENVASQIDEGYEIKVPIPATVTGATDLIWEIEYDYTEETASEFKGVWLDGEKLVKDVDYTVESGSTKITIKSQTVKNSNNGKHTIAAEYRTSTTNEVKKSAQNYTKQSSTNNNTGSSGGGGTASYKVTFETNGGSAIDAKTIKQGSTVTDLPTPTIDGFVFAGWYKDVALTQAFDSTTKITAKITLYAKWDELHQVTFETNGGSAVEAMSVQNGKTIAQLPTSTKENYALAGWYKDAELTQVYDANEAVTAAMTLYAKWNVVIPDEAPEDASGFIDVTKADWFYDDVQWAYANEIMVGYNNAQFAPNDAITGGMVVAVLARLADVDVSEYEATQFEDVYEGQWYTPYAKWAKAVGLVEGIPFNPPAEITREWMGIVLDRYLDYVEAEYDITEEIVEFADSDLISDEAMEAMQTLFKLEIFRGKGNNVIDPVSNTTRAEFAALIHRVETFLNK